MDQVRRSYCVVNALYSTLLLYCSPCWSSTHTFAVYSTMHITVQKSCAVLWDIHSTVHYSEMFTSIITQVSFNTRKPLYVIFSTFHTVVGLMCC